MGLWQYLMGEQPGIFESIENYKNKGQYGEYLTEYALNNYNLKGYLITFTNLYIPYKGRTTEIDVLMLHQKGIFVFESKNYSGWIFGSENQQKWTQALNGKKNQFYNPIHQNNTHIKALSEYLTLPPKSFFSYIVFSERCELKCVPNDTDSFTILRRHHLLRDLRQKLEKAPAKYSHEEIENLSQKLLITCNASEQTKKQHMEAVQARTTGNICPFCGGTLVEREGKFGKFYGCSNYPKCKFTRKLK